MGKLDEIEKRCNAASTAPWRVSDNCGEDWLICSLGNSSATGDDCYVTTDSVRASEMDGDASTDAAFISAARTDVPYLLARLRKAEALLRDLGADDDLFTSWRKDIAAHFEEFADE